MGCRFSKFDEDEGYQCSETGCRCEFMFPNEEACYQLFGEGPLAFEEEAQEQEEE
ncbi:MAG: hypothetical protein Q606_CBAC00005G0023 [Intestinibacter bartlettii DORA_8_9]|jgi:hypothetical protein|nr:MAG: hypothetical protein Q606_CBAC00005G0023 [Intestinibacter bartlettii DORA_8_9]